MESSAASTLCRVRKPSSGSTKTRSSMRNDEWKPTPSSHRSEWGLKDWCRSLISHAKAIHSPGLPDQPKVRHR
eukprot:4548066-Heterocapsa_arctica.AAC.1